MKSLIISLISGHLVWGDAPYFYKEGLKELVNLPVAWTSRGNTLGGSNLFLWIYPIMFLYGVLGTYLHFNNDLILRVLFYFPSLFFGILGFFLLTKKLKFSKTVTFFAVLVYLVNTYFLLLVDGGQVGVVLAYGLFPFVLNFLLRDNFLVALAASFVLTVVDFRIGAICIFTSFLLKPGLRRLKSLVLILICLVGLSAYWLIPALNLSSGLQTSFSGLQNASLLNSLFLFSPNWPANEFGKTVAPYFYFVLVPVLIFIPLFIVKQKKIIWLTLCFLIFAFLAKGSAAPFGMPYAVLVNTKFGSVFRDSTKFFIPLVLLGGILIGKTVDIINKKFFTVSVFIYILVLVNPLFLGRLNGALGKNPDISDYQKIYSLISSDQDFLRSAWFNEKSPFAFHTEEKQSLDAKDLVNFRPFATMNVGTGDHFNFINDKEYLDWFNLLGIKYLIFNGNPRVVQMNKSDQADWNRITNLVSKDNRLQKINIGTNIPIYENPEIKPHEFFVEKTFVVVGGEDVYQKFKNLDSNFSVGNQGFLFAEDGKLDPSTLQNIASTSAILIFNNKTEADLKMSFLVKDFVTPASAYKKEWSVFSASQYLEYKYQLLIRDIKINDFDYGLGIALSTRVHEKMYFKLNIPIDGNYILVTRTLDDKNQNMTWNFKEENDLKQGSFNYVHENEKGTEILNAVGLIPKSDMDMASQLTQNFMGYFAHFDLSDQNDRTKLQKVLETNKWETWPTSTDVAIKTGWIIFTDSYNPNWILHKGVDNLQSFSMYSMINGFYVHPEWGVVEIQFKGVEYLRWGIYFSVLSVLVIAIFVLWKKSEK